MMLKEAAVAELYRHLPGRTEESHENPQSVIPVSVKKFEPGTSRILSKRFNQSTAQFLEAGSVFIFRTVKPEPVV
jgi:hypothetical protein